jgi:flagellar motor switch protein FliG
MSIIARHKKPGGFRKLVNSLETTPVEKRIKILDSLRREDPAFVEDVEACIFNFEEFGALNDLVMAEIVGSLKPGDIKSLAYALYKCPDTALVEKFTKNMMPPIFFQYREHSESISQLHTYEQVGGRFRIIEKARELEEQRKFTLKKYISKYQD